MIVRFDSLNRAETPLFTLCNPGSVCSGGMLTKVVGGLVDHEAEEIVFNFNSTSELNMRVNRVSYEDAEENKHISDLYKAIQNRRLIFVDDIGFFVITEVRDGFNDGLHFKDIRAESVEYELSQKMVPFIADGTYKFKSNTLENDGILDKIIASLPLWSIGHVDEDIANKYRTFEDVDTSTNCLSFLLESVQDAYECIIVFDCINRVVSVYSQENYVNKTDIHISQSDFINSIEVTEDVSDLYTAIRVLGNDDVMISAVNPIGTNVIYNFSYYTDWMSKSLSAKVKEWQSLIKENEEEYRSLNLAYYEQLEQANILNLEIKKIAAQITMYERCRDNIVAGANNSLINDYNDVIKENGGTPITICDEISQTVEEINGLIQECKSDNDETVLKLDEVNAQIDVIKPKITAIQDKLAFQSYFSGEELDELNYYIYEGSYTDEYVTFTDIMSYSEKFNQMTILYNRAVSQLNKISIPTQEFTVDAENFVFVKEFEPWSHQLKTGCLVNVEISRDDIAELFLSNITINYDDKTLSMTFGNRFNKFDPKTLFEDVLGNISKSANTIEYIKDIISPIKHGEFNSVKEAIQTSRDLTMGSALSSKNEEVIIDGSGYTGRSLLENGEYDPKQIKITGRNIVFTDDSWETSKTAIGDLVLGDGKSVYGINAEAVIGDIIVGNNLKILDEDGNDVLSTLDNKIILSVKNVTTAVEDQGKELDDLKGQAITSSVTEYYLSSSKTEPVGGEWSAKAPEWKDGWYMWSRTRTERADGGSSISSPTCIAGATGASGADGKGIQSITEYYAISSSNTTAPASWSTSMINTTSTNKYLWNYERITYTDGSIEDTTKRIIGTHGSKGDKGDSGTSGVGIKSVDVQYYLSSSSSTTTGGSWSTIAPDWVDGKYMWSKTVTTLTSGGVEESNPVCITGAKGSTGSVGETGETGTGVSSITEEYYLSTSKATQSGGDWVTTPPTWSSGKYVWTRSKIVYTNPDSTEYTTPICDSSWEAVNEVEVGGRNLILNSNNDGTGWSNTSYNIIDSLYLSPDASDKVGQTDHPVLIDGETYTISVKAKIATGAGVDWLAAYWTGNIKFASWTPVFDKDHVYTETFRANHTHATGIQDKLTLYIGPDTATRGNNTIYWVKIEKGNKATDWTPAPEDMATAEDAQNAQESADKAQGTADENAQSIKDMGASLKILEDSISSLVVDEEGFSLMEQSGGKWTFNMGAIQQKLSDTAEDLKGLEDQVDGVDNLVDKLDSLTQDISLKTAYITLATTDTGQPCIELGKQGDDFKLRITNTSVDFMDGSDRIAYVSNKTLYIERAIIKDELQIGDGKGFIWKRRSNGNMGLRWIGW